MEVFIVLFLYLLAIGLFSYSINDGNKRRIFQTYASGLGLWCILALRSPLCGVDLYKYTPGDVSYFSVFQDVQNYTIVECLDVSWMIRTSMDIGWIEYNKLVSLFTHNFQLLLIFTSFIEIGLISRIIYKFSSHIVFSFIIFFTLGFYFISFSALRQSMAISITAYSFIYLFEKKYIKFSLFVILAALFHFSAIFFLIMYPLSRIRFNRRLGLWALAIIIILIPFLSIIVQIIMHLLLGGMRSVETDKGGAYTLFILYSVIYLMTLLFLSDSIYHDYLKKFMLMAVAGQSLGVISTGHFTRIALFFSIFFILSIPQIFDNYIETKYRRVSMVIASFFLFSFFCYVSKDGYLNVVPYSFFWEVNI